MTPRVFGTDELVDWETLAEEIETQLDAYGCYSDHWVTEEGIFPISVTQNESYLIQVGIFATSADAPDGAAGWLRSLFESEDQCSLL